MPLSLQAIQTAWGNNSPLNNLLPSSQVWLDFPADSSPQSGPYAVITQTRTEFDYTFGGARYIQTTMFNIKVWSGSLAQASAINDLLIPAIQFQPVSNATMALYLENVVPHEDKAGAYFIQSDWRLVERFGS